MRSVNQAGSYQVRIGPILFSYCSPFCQPFTFKGCLNYQFHTQAYQWKLLFTYLSIVSYKTSCIAMHVGILC